MLAALLLILPVDREVRAAALGAVALAWIALTAYGSAVIGANWFVRSRNRLKSRDIAITFDDGPDPEITPLVLSVLKEKKVPATFFLIGEKAEKYPHLVRQILAEGHQIGNHSYSHSNRLGFFSANRLRGDLQKCSRVLEGISGEKVRLFRPPFGVTNPRYPKALTSLGLVSVGWSLRSYDTAISNSAELLSRLVSRVREGRIVLMHDTLPQTAEVLPSFLDYCRSKGLEVGRLAVKLLIPWVVMLYPGVGNAQDYRKVTQPEQVYAALKQRSEKVNTIQADFIETRYVSYLKAPQKSSGKFYFEKKDRMRWEQTDPGSYIIMIDGSSLRVSEGGKEKNIRSASHMTGMIRDMLLMIVRGDYQSGREFERELLQNADGYRMVMRPVEKRLKQRYEKLELQFSKSTMGLEELVFFEKGGDRQVLTFRNEKINIPFDPSFFTRF